MSLVVAFGVAICGWVLFMGVLLFIGACGAPPDEPPQTAPNGYDLTSPSTQPTGSAPVVEAAPLYSPPRRVRAPLRKQTLPR